AAVAPGPYYGLDSW
nr:immunoglobulin heavy chain junction region [Macaca mulatta]MPN83278.1 immunoglobulin heavy chain junction region [Macaca mulatta]MPN83285.1 immunoglobulin heavy chain junction region [Macaca mulatta]MPN83293.1 immunoglobulin heavy chain junction region [Macaca mulatta]MPN83297.1 immunoglobulin heavy chain junction region [Macaca mulatta]